MCFDYVYNPYTIRIINEMLVFLTISAKSSKNSKRAITPLYNRLSAFGHRIRTHGISPRLGYIDHIGKIFKNHGFLVLGLLDKAQFFQNIKISKFQNLSYF